MSRKKLKSSFKKYALRDLGRGLYYRIYRKRYYSSKYADRSVFNIEEGNAFLRSAIKQNHPYMVARYGANELTFTTCFLMNKKVSEKNKDNMCICAGFFPRDDQSFKRYSELMVEFAPNIDMAALFYARGEEFMLSQYSPEALLVHNRAIEPWYTPDSPWTAELKGKKVLVIHPFEQTILSQYQKRERLFPETDILPEFELKTVKAVQTIAGEKDPRFETWFDALDYMFDEAMKQDFDVALIGCGAYGLPLAAKIKQAGKIGIHLGGALQLLFGIKGARWDNHPTISKFYNDAWVRPSDADKPKNSKKVENGCYW